MVEVDESMMAAAPKMASATAFIQEEAPDCSAATSKAYEKFEGDMAKITALKEKADGRANKAETEAQKQGGIARRCLAAEQLLSGDAKARREKLRAHIKKEVSIVEQQYAAKAKQLRMKKEVDQFAAQKAAFKLKGQRMKLRLKVELDNVQNKVTEAKKKQMAAEEGLKKAERTITRLEEKMKREAVLAKQKLDAVKGQLAAKIKECKSAHDATNIARDQAKKASQQTAHAQLAAKAAETAERVQVIKEQNKVKRLQASEASEAKTIRNDKVALAKEKAALHEALSKDKRAESALEKEKNGAKLASDMPPTRRRLLPTRFPA